MKLVIQRVLQASVSVEGELVSNIGKGFLVLVGICRDDQPQDSAYCVRKLLNLRLFETDTGEPWKKSVMDKDYELLCVSQFTLYSVLKGNKPDYHLAMGRDGSQPFYESFLAELKKNYKEDKIKDGLFGAMMQVSLVNDGPVTIEIESPPSKPDTRKSKANQERNKQKELETEEAAEEAR